MGSGVSVWKVREWLFGCSHRRKTLTRTSRTNVSANDGQTAEVETYMVCLQCGRHFAYDWTAMRPGRARVPANRARSRGNALLRLFAALLPRIHA